MQENITVLAILLTLSNISQSLMFILQAEPARKREDRRFNDEHLFPTINNFTN